MGRRFFHWLADTGHFLFALFYWNGRKTAYVWRGRRGRCPCQNESDDSIPGRVRCDAVLHWHNPARFQEICPLLIRTPEGWRCSVHASAVRPFWGRVVRWLAVGTLAVYLGGVSIVWTGLRTIGGAPVTWPQVAWPGWWHQIKQVQAAHLFREAMNSFAGGKLSEARVKLTTARELDPANYEATLMLAQIAMFERSYLFADELFMNLWRNQPDDRQRTAVTYHDTLLSLDRMDKLAELSVAMATADPARAVVWMRSALLSARSMRAGDAAVFRQQQAAPIAALPPHGRLLLEAELDLRAGDGIGARTMLHRRFDGPFNPFYVQYQIERLAGLGAADAAQRLLDAQGNSLGEFEQRVTQFAVAQLAGDEVLARAYFRALLRLPLNPSRVERLATLLITYPDADHYRELAARLREDPRLEQAADGATLWVTGIACDAPGEAKFWQSRGRQSAAGGYPPIEKFDYGSRNLLAPASVCHLINVVTFPREVILALLGRVTPQAEEKPGPAGR